LEQLIYANVYKALATYQQQQRLAVIQRQQAATTTAKLKPQSTKRKKQLTNKAKRASHVPAPKPLAQPQQQAAPTQPSTPTSYNPIKVPKPLPAPTRAVIKQNAPPKKMRTLKTLGMWTKLHVGYCHQANVVRQSGSCSTSNFGAAVLTAAWSAHPMQPTKANPPTHQPTNTQRTMPKCLS